jgi:predicted nucleic acid-binding protein
MVVNDGELILDAIEIHSRYQYSFWDSLIIQAAVRSRASLLLSEDLSDWQIIDHVTIKNPFLKSSGFSF